MRFSLTYLFFSLFAVSLCSCQPPKGVESYAITENGKTRWVSKEEADAWNDAHRLDFLPPRWRHKQQEW